MSLSNFIRREHATTTLKGYNGIWPTHQAQHRVHYLQFDPMAVLSDKTRFRRKLQQWLLSKGNVEGGYS